MRIALITPMKPPSSPIPSGDRTFARLITAALQSAGHTVLHPSLFSTWCRAGADFEAVSRAAPAQIEAAINALSATPPDAVLTYHNYHKAPDLLGPPIAEAFRVPYAIIEASRAPKRAEGEWAKGFAAADQALGAAGALGAVTRRDWPALEAFAPDKVVATPPFIDTAPFTAPHVGSADGGHIVCAAMMREGRKADSVALLAKALDTVRQRRPSARLTIAGDGEARGRLEPLFAPGTFVGLMDRAQLADLFARSDVFVWPAIAEPFGFVFLEAQAAGLPVVGGNAPGVRDIVEDGSTGHLVPENDAPALAAALDALLGDRQQRRAMGAAARRFAQQNDLAAGAERLEKLLALAAAQSATA